MPNLFGTAFDGLRLPGSRLRLGKADPTQAISGLNLYRCAAVAPLWTWSRHGRRTLVHRPSVLCTVLFPGWFRDAGIGIPMCALGTLRSASPRGRRPHRTLFGTLGDGFFPPATVWAALWFLVCRHSAVFIPLWDVVRAELRFESVVDGLCPPPAVCPREVMTINDSR